MADVTQGIDSYFYLSVLMSMCGGLTLFIRFAYKSKCKTAELCCLKIDRDIETELKENMSLSPSSPNLASSA